MDFETLYGRARGLPIIDWHNHLDMRMLAEDKPLGSLYEVWVKADPYKHRAMRICGEPERLITGTGTTGVSPVGNGLPGTTGVSPVEQVPESEKWAAWMRTLPQLVGNPIFAWAKMELEWLGLDANAYLRGEGENITLSDWTPSKMLSRFKVEYLSPCMTASSLGQRASRPLETAPVVPVRVVPSLRMNAGDEVAEEVLERFHAAGCRVVDISVDDAAQLETCYDSLASVAAFAAAHGWTMLLHLGALRETSARLRAAAGPVGGFAGMRAPVDPAAVAAFLDRLECNGQDARCPSVTGETPVVPACNGQDARCPSGLPRTVLLTLNPEAHAQLAVLAGSFVEEGVPGKVQLGPAWWWCDHAEAIRDVFEKQAAYGVLSAILPLAGRQGGHGRVPRRSFAPAADRRERLLPQRARDGRRRYRQIAPCLSEHGDGVGESQRG